jgi:Tfp pilus assembly protein PilV
MTVFSGLGRSAFTLVEVSIAAGVISVGAVAVVNMVSTGARSARTTARYETIAQLTHRVMEAQMNRGYDALHAQAGTAGPVNLTIFADPGQVTNPASPALIIDGATYTARMATEDVASCPGLVKLQLTMRWEPLIPNPATPPGSFELSHFVADPQMSLKAR